MFKTLFGVVNALTKPIIDTVEAVAPETQFVTVPIKSIAESAADTIIEAEKRALDGQKEGV